MSIETAGEPSFGNVQRQMQRMMEQMQKGFFNFCPSETWTPSVNLYENETTYVVCVDLSGVDKDRIDVTVVDGKLMLRGTRDVPTPPEHGPAEEHGHRLKVHVMEIDHGPFCREVELPQDVDRDQIAASHRNGMLWIELPKK